MANLNSNDDLSDDLESPSASLHTPSSTSAPTHNLSHTTSPAPPTTFTTTSTDPSTNPRPLILCLHGGGSTSTVFKIQSRRLIWALSSQFRFIFASAPHEGAPGFGMLPVFASCAPFHRWVTRKWMLGEGDVETTPDAETNMVDDVLDECVARETGMAVEDVRTGEPRESGWGNVVGVMGFSQGARLVPGLLLRQKILEREGKPSRWNLKFGVVVGGPYPPIALSQDVDIADYELLRSVPTIHAWGRDDHVKSGCVEMQKACDGDECFQMDFDGGHHMPLKDVEAKDLCDLILAGWYAGGGTMGVPAGEKY